MAAQLNHINCQITEIITQIEEVNTHIAEVDRDIERASSEKQELNKQKIGINANFIDTAMDVHSTETCRSLNDRLLFVDKKELILFDSRGMLFKRKEKLTDERKSLENDLKTLSSSMNPGKFLYIYMYIICSNLSYSMYTCLSLSQF